MELNHVYYSFNAREYFRLKALNTKALNADLIPQTEAELTDESGEESEEDRQYRIRALRRKRGTLRR